MPASRTAWPLVCDAARFNSTCHRQQCSVRALAQPVGGASAADAQPGAIITGSQIPNPGSKFNHQGSEVSSTTQGSVSMLNTQICS